MATRETRADRGRRQGLALLARLISELVDARKTAGVSQQALARVLGWSQSAVSRFERMLRPDQISLVEVAQVASALGLAFGGSLYPLGDPLRDKGHQALIRRFRAILSAGWRVAAEVPLPNLADPRAWDLLLRLGNSVVGVEAETRLRDLQAFVRRIRQRERDGGVDVIVIALIESAVNRRLLPQLLEALGPDYATPPRVILGALRKGEPLPGSGVVLI